MIGSETKGVFAIAPTPFAASGALDVASLARMTEWYLERDVDGITILGIMGEAQKLRPEESLTVVREVIGAAAGKPIIVGVSSPGMAAIHDLAAASMDAGAAGVMMTPPGVMRTDDQIAGWFANAVDAIGDDTPWVLQDHPTVTGVLMSPALIRQVVAAHDGCVMLKHEDWPGLEKISAIRDWQAAGEMHRCRSCAAMAVSSWS